MNYSQAFSKAGTTSDPALAAKPRWRKPVFTCLALLVSCWLLLYALYVALPLVRPGAVIIYDAKFQTLAVQPMFTPADRTRILVFGNSKTLSGFRPDEFDAALGPGVRSYNLGLPGDTLFLPILETALDAGNIPTHVLLTIGWDGKLTTPGFIEMLRDDAALAKYVVPFRTLPRDAVLFAYNNRLRFLRGYRDAAEQRELMIRQRGWYFIKGQSHFPDDRLPDDFKLPTDRPHQLDVRTIPPHSLVRSRLAELAERHKFQILLVPSNSRAGEFSKAPAADADRDVGLTAFSRVRIIGPDYLTYAANRFADPVHLNPQGASLYTADLAALIKKHMAH